MKEIMRKQKRHSRAESRPEPGWQAAPNNKIDFHGFGKRLLQKGGK